jgi:hypothetical protein
LNRWSRFGRLIEASSPGHPSEAQVGGVGGGAEEAVRGGAESVVRGVVDVGEHLRVAVHEGEPRALHLHHDAVPRLERVEDVGRVEVAEVAEVEAQSPQLASPVDGVRAGAFEEIEEGEGVLKVERALVMEVVADESVADGGLRGGGADGGVCVRDESRTRPPTGVS